MTRPIVLGLDLVQQARWCLARTQELGLPPEILAFTFAAALAATIERRGPNRCGVACLS